MTAYFSLVDCIACYVCRGGPDRQRRSVTWASPRATGRALTNGRQLRSTQAADATGGMPLETYALRGWTRRRPTAGAVMPSVTRRREIAVWMNGPAGHMLLAEGGSIVARPVSDQGNSASSPSPMPPPASAARRPIGCTSTCASGVTECTGPSGRHLTSTSSTRGPSARCQPCLRRTGTARGRITTRGGRPGGGCDAARRRCLRPIVSELGPA